MSHLKRWILGVLALVLPYKPMMTVSASVSFFFFFPKGLDVFLWL